jgi:hypothetical protein
MLEIGVLVFILLAAGYWATMWVMGRRDDVLHGHFVDLEGEDDAMPAMAVAAPSPVPTRAKPHAPAPKPVAAAAPAADGEALQSLLASIKQELKNASQI